MIAVGDIVVQQGGAAAGRVGSVVSICRSGRLVVRNASGKTFQCRSGNARLVLEEFKTAHEMLQLRSGTSTQLQFFAALNEWTRLAQLCLGLGLQQRAREIMHGKRKDETNG